MSELVEERSLSEIVEGHAGRVLHKFAHYVPIYERHLSQFRGRRVTMVEIGVSHGGSLQMWKKWLGPQATLIGVDINPLCKQVEEEQINVRIGRQTDATMWDSILAEFGQPDIVLDDGSHVMKDVEKTWRYVYPRVSRSGVYVVEDMHTAYLDHYGGGVERDHNFINTAKSLVDEMHAFWDTDEEEIDDLAYPTVGVSLYRSVVVFQKGDEGGAARILRSGEQTLDPSWRC
ncbi:class I SAM-dependent methyltransferase [Enterovirga rhinocerotis]|uniref:Methyltransferase family protein n=1 Tax=Enterovirga rhinocerotis TaxID=1339210 RepID=A0A4R7CA68_9HYPH|nr:class I SAM-dependent methyltransferase [Enterovirga rhinocerotis]TDR95324.1 methyltransferase family protein [Enterovirga rhinocerotis]